MMKFIDFFAGIGVSVIRAIAERRCGMAEKHILCISGGKDSMTAQLRLWDLEG